MTSKWWESFCPWHGKTEMAPANPELDSPWRKHASNKFQWFSFWNGSPITCHYFCILFELQQKKSIKHYVGSSFVWVAWVLRKRETLAYSQYLRPFHKKMNRELMKCSDTLGNFIMLIGKKLTTSKNPKGILLMFIFWYVRYQQFQSPMKITVALNRNTWPQLF